jgi:hypothetical protein
MREWLRRRLINLLLVEVDTGSSKKIRTALGRASIQEDICVSDNNIELPDPINFRVQTVSGGTVVESRWYDYKKDEERVKLHIITQDESLSESIGKIVTMELLQK